MSKTAQANGVCVDYEDEDDETPLDLSAEAREVIKSLAMQKSLAKSGAAEFWLQHLQGIDIPFALDKNDHCMIQQILDIAVAYSLAVVYEYDSSDKHVCRFFELIESLEDEDCGEELDALEPLLPTEFKDTMEAACAEVMEVFHTELVAHLETNSKIAKKSNQKPRKEVRA